ncbi:MAG: UPF0280 family protein [Phycisphaerae bacterium]|jgi:hypothetical protein|nr:UPF0280 family protein [Phycisphaerae bacterium]
MSAGHEYRRFAHKGANFRILCERFDAITDEIVRLRGELEEYIARHGEFASSLMPVELLDDAPEIARRMAEAAKRVGVGPMAAVAGTVAQMSALAAGDAEAIVENGGDVFLAAKHAVTVGLYAGQGPLSDSLALSVPPQAMPLAACSSSGVMGHSLSLGKCDLACVVSRNASLADAAATHAANLVKTPDDIEAALEQIVGINGVDGVLLVQGDRIGVAGDLPPLVRNRDAELGQKVTRDPDSG